MTGDWNPAAPGPALLASRTGDASELPSSASPGVLGKTWGDLRAAPRRLWEDQKAVLGRPLNWYLLLGAGAYGLASQSWEDRERDYFADHRILGTTARDVLGAMGNAITIYAGTLGWYFWTSGVGDEQGNEASKTVLSAVTVTTVDTLVLKTLVRDDRPNGDPHNFPSGHASLSMAVASSLDGLYGHAVGIPAMLVSGLIGLQRLDKERHDTGAVVFGWVLGYVVGHTLSRRDAPRIFGMDLGLVVDPDTGEPALSLSWSP